MTELGVEQQQTQVHSKTGIADWLNAGQVDTQWNQIYSQTCCHDILARMSANIVSLSQYVLTTDFKKITDLSH